jgi:hypothetical protein
LRLDPDHEKNVAELPVTLVPLHWSTVEALAHYRKRRCRATHTSAQMPFFIGSHGHPFGHALG